MSKYIDIQDLVDNYRTLSIIIRKCEGAPIYETEVYNKGVKLFVGRDNVCVLSLARALCAILRFIDDKKINRHTELTSKEATKWLEVLDGIKNDKEVIGIFVSSHLQELLD